MTQNEDAGSVIDRAFEGINFPRYRAIKTSDIHAGCCGEPEFWIVEHERGECEPSSLEVQMIEKLRAEAPEGTQVTFRVHRGACFKCGDSVNRSAVRVVVKLHGVLHAREYSLDLL
jgi:broad specificity phosphatase PhoE